MKRMSPGEAWSDFRQRIESTGGIVVESQWLGSGKPHRVRCVNGHDGVATPASVRRGIGCRACAGRDPVTAWKTFRNDVEALGGTVLEDAWKGSTQPHRVRCAEGHQNNVRPNGLQQGRPLCKLCRQRREASVFYVVTGRGMVKFGVTVDDPDRRMSDHARDDLETPLFFRDQLTRKLVQSLEVTLHHALLRAGYRPVQGREYFDAAATPLVLAIVHAVLP